MAGFPPLQKGKKQHQRQQQQRSSMCFCGHFLFATKRRACRRKEGARLGVVVCGVRACAPLHAAAQPSIASPASIQGMLCCWGCLPRPLRRRRLATHLAAAREECCSIFGVSGIDRLAPMYCVVMPRDTHRSATARVNKARLISRRDGDKTCVKRQPPRSPQSFSDKSAAPSQDTMVKSRSGQAASSTPGPDLFLLARRRRGSKGLPHAVLPRDPGSDEREGENRHTDVVDPTRCVHLVWAAPRR
ncbi:hypothetical protein MRX96_018549 [Rhipicephalus microplus]